MCGRYYQGAGASSPAIFEIAAIWVQNRSLVRSTSWCADCRAWEDDHGADCV